MKWTSEEIKYLQDHYPVDTWDALLQHFSCSKDTIIHKACELGIKRACVFWDNADVRILTDAYNNHIPAKDIAVLLGGKYSEASIRTKANKLGLKSRNKWTDEEIKILKQYYSIIPTEDMLSMLPGRTVLTIQDKARSIGLHSFTYVTRAWRTEEDAFIRANWQKMGDEKIAHALNRTCRAVKWRREKLGLLYETAPGTYEYLRKYLWKANRQWRKASIEACGYKCIVTGGRFSAVHHLYASNLIVEEVLGDLGLEYGKVSDYSEAELELIATMYAERNKQYPLGVCLSEEVHKHFHDTYGYGNNTPEQFYEFLSLYYPQTQIPVTIKAA